MNSKIKLKKLITIFFVIILMVCINVVYSNDLVSSNYGQLTTVSSHIKFESHEVFQIHNNSDQNLQSLFSDTHKTNTLNLINVNQYVVRVKGGLKQAKKIASKFNLKFIKQVSY